MEPLRHPGKMRVSSRISQGAQSGLQQQHVARMSAATCGKMASEPRISQRAQSGLRANFSARHRLLHHRDELLERERLWQEVELLAVGQALFEGILRVAGHEDDLDVRI